MSREYKFCYAFNDLPCKDYNWNKPLGCMGCDINRSLIAKKIIDYMKKNKRYRLKLVQYNDEELLHWIIGENINPDPNILSQSEIKFLRDDIKVPFFEVFDNGNCLLSIMNKDKWFTTNI